MSEKRCVRNNCNNDNCKTYVPKIGHLCDECIEEALLLYFSVEFRELTKELIFDTLDVFISSHKIQTSNVVEMRNFFKRHGHD